VLGWYDTKDKKVYDATNYQGLSLYQEWITHHALLYRMLTTTIHSEIVNRLLRNRFKLEFDIDVIAFRPDEEGYHAQRNTTYTDLRNDIWLSITDRPSLGNKSLCFSDEVKDCRWVSVLMNEFENEGLKRRALIPPIDDISPSWPVWFKDQDDLIQKYLDAYNDRKP
jgi:hypothetical protein